MAHEIVEIANVNGGEATYRVRAGDEDVGAREMDEHWADTILIDGNEIQTGNLTIEGVTAVLTDCNASTITIKL